MLNGCNKQETTDNARIKPTNEPRMEITDYYTTVDNFIGYDVEDNILLLLCADEIERININDLQ